MYNFFHGLVSAFCEWLLDTIFYVFDWLGSTLLGFMAFLVEYAIETIGPGTGATLSQSVLGPIYPYLALARYWLPVDSVMGVFATTLVTVAFIRLARWAFAFVPTLGG